MGLALKHPTTRQPSSQGGFSLLEVLFASVILLAAMLGVAGLFMRAMANNLEGRESSLVSSFARSHAEELQAIDLEQDEVKVPGGSTERQEQLFWDSNLKEWTATEPTSGSPWQRTTRIQFFNISDLSDDPVGQLPKFNNPLDGSTPVEHVSIREIRVVIEGQRESSGLGSARSIDLTTARSF